MTDKTARQVLEEAKANNGNIPVWDFKPLYRLGDYMVEGEIPLRAILHRARVFLIDIRLPLPDISNLLETCNERQDG